VHVKSWGRTPEAQKSDVAGLVDFPEDSVEKVHAFFERSFELSLIHI